LGNILGKQDAIALTWVLEKRARRRCGEQWNCLDQPRRATPWRIWKLLRQELAIAISGVLNWNLSRWQACVEAMQGRPRQRKLQTLPHRVNRLLVYCQAHGLSNIRQAELKLAPMTAYRQALEVRTREELPQDWAMTQNNLGNALSEQGTRTEGEAGRRLLAEAMAA
jgi:adenylate kinase family enzyme